MQPRADLDDLHVSSEFLWRTRPGLVRLVHRPLCRADVEDLAEVARAGPLAEAVLVEGVAGDERLLDDEAVLVIRAGEFARRIRASVLIEWQQGWPRPALGRLRLAYDLDEIAVALDPIGLRWLPTLACDQLPSELEGAGVASDLFERMTFRILTTALRFGGQRLGARQRGERVPDAVLRWSSRSALLDCKASHAGYRMGINDQRALAEYHARLQATEAGAGHELSHIVVVSSAFDGEPGRRHPYHGRAKNLARECGARLVYLRAADLVRLVMIIESEEADPGQRESIRWETLFDIGMPTGEEVTAIWPQAE